MLYLFLLLFFFTPFLFAQSYIQKNCAADTARANELFALAEKLRKASRLDSAALCYEQAAEIWENACPEIKGQKRKRFWQEYLKSKNRRGFVFYLQGKADSLAVYYLQNALEKALPWLGEKHPIVGACYSNLGILYVAQGRSARALEYHQKALAIHAAAWGEKHPIVALNYNNIANVYRNQGHYAEALQYYQKALDIQLNVFGEKPHEAAVSYNNMANVYRLRGRYAEALQYYHKALDISLSYYGENHPDVAASYNNIGMVYQAQGRYMEALQRFQKALAIRLAAYGENHPDVATNYNNIGIVYQEQRRYAEALQCYQKALTIQLVVLGETHPDLAMSYNNIAVLYVLQERYNEALQYYQKALATQLAAYGENHHETAMNYHNIGMMYKKQARYAESLQYLQKALAIQLTVWGENHTDVAKSYNNIASNYFLQGLYAEALQYYAKALAIQLTVFGENHPDVALSYNNISYLYQAQGRYAQALASCQKALESNALYWKSEKVLDLPSPSTFILNPEYLLTTLEKQAQTLFHACLFPEEGAVYRSSLPYALRATHYGAHWLNRLRQTMRRETDQIELGKKATELFSAGIACAFLMDSLGMKEQAPLKQAFFFSESNKAAALNLAIQESEALVAAGIPQSLNALQQDYKRELTLCNQQLETVLKPQTKEDTLKKQYYENRRFTYAAKLDSLIHALEKEYPKYYELKYATFTPSVDTLQKALLAQSPNTAIVEYFVSDTALFVFALNAKSLAAKKIPLSSKELKKLLNELGRSYYALTESQRQDPNKKQKYIAAAAKLYQNLMAPVEEIFKNKEELVIIPDGGLWELPFEILIKVKTEAEAKKLEKLPFEKLPLLNPFHAIGYSPSATAFLRSLFLPPAKGKGFFAVAPVFDFKGEKMFALRSGLEREVTYPEAVFALPGSESEVHELKRLFESQNLPVKTLLREQAREEAFTALPLQDYRYIHLATHGVFNRNKPSWSYLLFAPPQDSAPVLARDGLLTAAECYNFKARCRAGCAFGLRNGSGRAQTRRGVGRANAGVIV
jgi:tetratricopeptide (TPR) repeat protein